MDYVVHSVDFRDTARASSLRFATGPKSRSCGRGLSPLAWFAAGSSLCWPSSSSP